MDKFQAIYKLYPNITVIRGDVAYDKDEQEVTYDNNAVETEIAKHSYKQQRVSAYPTWQEQLDNIYHNGIDSWKADIKAIKDKYPKGNK